MFSKDLMAFYAIGDDMLFPDFDTTIYSNDDVHSWLTDQDCFIIVDNIKGALYIGDSVALDGTQTSIRCLAFYAAKGTYINAGFAVRIIAYPLKRGGS